MNSKSRLIVPYFMAALLAAFPIPAAENDHYVPSTPGALTVAGIDGDLVEMPLVHTSVRVDISSFVARTTVEQTFRNPFDVPVEAIYTFPLGDTAAVDDFELRVGYRVIRGEIHRREEAREIYEEAVADGYRAALLEQETPNIFTQAVANLVPGEDVIVRIRTVELLNYEKGAYEYLFPLVVGPRYDPGDTDPVTPSPETQRTSRLNPPRLASGERSGQDVSIEVDIDAGLFIRSLHSPSHGIDVSRQDSTTGRVVLSPEDRIPNRDFILRWDVSSEEPALGVLAHRSGVEGYFAFLVQPKGEAAIQEAAPKEIILVLDTSGSMDGVPIRRSKAFLRQALRSMGEGDTFNLVQFAGSSSVFAGSSLENSPSSVEKACRWIGDLHGGGGTEMLGGLRRAVQTPGDDDRYRMVIVLTDGYIGNERQIFAEIAGYPEDVRVFTVGIGSSVNHHLLRGMAEVGRGAYTYIPADGEIDEALERFRDWVTRPYLTDLEIDWGALPVADLTPERPADLFSGQNLAVVGRYLGGGEGWVTVRGRKGGAYWEEAIYVRVPEAEEAHAALASIWARRRIDDLKKAALQATGGNVREEITELALEHRILCEYTSFVAVDSSEVVNPGGALLPVEQAVPFPEGVKEKTTFTTEYTSPTQVSEQVKVCAERDIIDLDRTEASTKFSNDFIQDLPVAGRQYQNIVTMAPGVNDPNTPSVHGSRSRDFRPIVSGVAAVDPLTGRIMGDINADTIEDMEVVTAGGGVEFGRAQGGYARIVQKQGGNQLEGAVDLAVRLDGLEGTGSSSQEDADGPLGMLRGSAFISGPIIKDKLWYRLSQEWIRETTAIDVLHSVEAVETRSSNHADQLTWQVSPRNKLAFRLRLDDLKTEALDVTSLVHRDATMATDRSVREYSLHWTAPVSPKLLVETSVSHTTRQYEAGPTSPGAGTWSLDLVVGQATGAHFRTLLDDIRRTAVANRTTFYAGRFAGANHQIRAGATIEEEEVLREIERRPGVYRFVSDRAGLTQETLIARIAESPRSSGETAASRLMIWVEDQLKPTNDVTITAGLRLDHDRIDAPTPAGAGRNNDLGIESSDLSPFLAAAWMPFANGKLKLSVSFRRSSERIPALLPLVAWEPVTTDVPLRPEDGTPLPVPEEELAQTRQAVDPDLRAPRQDEWTVAVERELWAETSFRVSLFGRSFDRQFRQVEVEDGLFLVRSDGSGQYRALEIDFRRRQYRGWEAQGLYTLSEATGDGQALDLMAAGDRTLFAQRPGHDPTDRRHRFRFLATTITPWGFRFGGAARWESGLPYSVLDLDLSERSGGPRLQLDYPTDRRNDQRNGSFWNLDLNITREIQLPRGTTLWLRLEVFNLLDDEMYLVYSPANGTGRQINGFHEGVHRVGRRLQLGCRFMF